VRAGERGSLALEAALVAPVILMLFTLVMIAGRVQQDDSSVEAAARAGARAGSLNPNGDIEGTAKKAATDWLSSNGITCAGGPRIGVNVHPLTVPAPAGVVRVVAVNVECDVPVSDLSPVRVPGTWPLKDGFRSVIDVYHG
jgi:Flp pilus assembly protein TadG